MRKNANNKLLEEKEKLREKREALASLDKETRRSLLSFYHWEAMSPAMIRKTADYIQRGL